MAKLADVVAVLQEQNKTLGSVEANLSKILAEDVARKKKEASEAGDKREAALEAKRAAAKAKRAPKTIAQGVSKSLGITDLFDSLKNALGLIIPAGIGGSLAGMLGMAIGSLFKMGVGYLLGATYLTPWIEEKLGTWNVDLFEAFGKEWSIADLAGPAAGAAALIFGPKIIGSLFTSYVEKDPDGKLKLAKMGFLKRLGLAGVILTAGSFLGDYLADATGFEGLDTAVSNSALFASIGMMFGPKGALIGALAGLAFTGIKAMTNWLRGRDDEVRNAAYSGLKKYENMTNEEIADMSNAEKQEMWEVQQKAKNEAERALRLNRADIHDDAKAILAQIEKQRASGELDHTRQSSVDAKWRAFAAGDEDAGKDLFKSYQELTGGDLKDLFDYAYADSARALDPKTQLQWNAQKNMVDKMVAQQAAIGSSFYQMQNSSNISRTWTQWWKDQWGLNEKPVMFKGQKEGELILPSDPRFNQPIIVDNSVTDNSSTTNNNGNSGGGASLETKDLLGQISIYDHNHVKDIMQGNNINVISITGMRSN